MAFSQIISNLWNYVSPRKTQQRREKPFKVPAIPVRTTVSQRRPSKPETRGMSPKTRVNVWSVRTPSPQSSLDPDADMDQTLLPPSPPSSTKQSDDFEGDTLVGSPTAEVSFKTGSSADEWNANEDTIAVDDGNYMGVTIDVDEEKRRRDRQGQELRDAGWSEDAVFLFQKLGLRGFEPILPIEWLDDLETLPEDLFTARPDKAFLRPAHGPWFRAQQALINLFDLGGRVRDAKLTKAAKRTPAYHIKRAVEKYTAMAMKDGEVDQLWSELPLFKTVTWAKNVHSSIGEHQMLEKLGDVHDQWYDALRIEEAQNRMDTVLPEVPTLYGITASHTVMAFVSYVAPTEQKEKPQLRLIALFDFGKEGYDVWNSLAVAIFVTHCRNRMMQLKDYLPEPELWSEEDPDL